jgi:hypothetical protein
MLYKTIKFIDKTKNTELMLVPTHDSNKTSSNVVTQFMSGISMLEGVSDLSQLPHFSET